MENKCCEKCYKIPAGFSTKQCVVRDCSCHTSPKEEEYTCEPCLDIGCYLCKNPSPKVSEWVKEFIESKIGQRLTPSERQWILLHFHKVLSSTEKRVAMEKDTELEQRVGMLRQWLNEDVITDPSKLVENEDLLSWLIKSKYE